MSENTPPSPVNAAEKGHRNSPPPTERPAPRHPDDRAARSWLTGEGVAPDGRVWSWKNPDHPGYPYPEAAGLWLTVAAQHPAFPRAQRDAVALALADSVSPAGGVGRDGVDYTFDTAVALHGLLAHARAGGTVADPRLPRRMLQFVADGITASRPVTGDASPDRWSTAWTCHQLKLSVTLSAFATLHGDAPCMRELAESLATRLLPLSQGGRFLSNAQRQLTYVHAHCYALEGLIGLQGLGIDTGDALNAGVSWLASVQWPDGSISAWHDGERPSGPRPSDVVAQAVRLWAIVDPRAYATPIARGLRYLTTLQTAGGGVRYAIDSADVNTWCTLFTAQATQFAREGRNGEWIA